MKVYKFFGNRVIEQEKWLNNMGMNGCKLIRVGMLSYTFQEFDDSSYTYDVHALSNLSYIERKKYIELLKKLNDEVFVKSTRIEFSFLSFHLKFGRKGRYLLTSPGRKKNEVAIVCKKK